MIPTKFDLNTHKSLSKTLTAADARKNAVIKIITQNCPKIVKTKCISLTEFLEKLFHTYFSSTLDTL